jgi:hypothetical protein
MFDDGRRISIRAELQLPFSGAGKAEALRGFKPAVL